MEKTWYWKIFDYFFLFPSFSGASHSMFGEMKTIEQETPVGAKSNRSNNNNFRDDDIEEDFETIIRFSSGPPK